MKKIDIKKNNQVFESFDSSHFNGDNAAFDLWVQDCIKGNRWGLPGEYEIITEDITLQVEAEKAAREAKELARSGAISALKAANIDGVGTIAALRPFIKHIITLLKD